MQKMRKLLRNQAILNSPGEVYSVEVNDKIPDDCRYPFFVIKPAQNQQQTNTGGIAKLLQQKIVAKVMLIVNMDIQECLINGQVGEVAHTDIVQII